VVKITGGPLMRKEGESFNGKGGEKHPAALVKRVSMLVGWA